MYDVVIGFELEVMINIAEGAQENEDTHNNAPREMGETHKNHFLRKIRSDRHVSLFATLSRPFAVLISSLFVLCCAVLCWLLARSTPFPSQGFTGHPMGVSFEDVAAVEVLHRGVLPPTAHNPVVDPTLVRFRFAIRCSDSAGKTDGWIGRSREREREREKDGWGSLLVDVCRFHPQVSGPDKMTRCYLGVSCNACAHFYLAIN